MYDIVNNLLHTTRQAMHIVYITFAMFSKHYSRKGMIVYTKYAMFIKQSPTHFAIVPKNDTRHDIDAWFISGDMCHMYLLIK